MNKKENNNLTPQVLQNIPGAIFYFSLFPPLLFPPGLLRAIDISVASKLILVRYLLVFSIAFNSVPLTLTNTC